MLYAADISEFQVRVDSSYPYRWLDIRCCDGDYLDANAVGNADWCRGAVLQGRMDGWTTYVVYRPGANAAILENLARVAPLDRVEIDVESWGGQIRGNHAAEINSLAGSLASIVGAGKVWVYGNVGDLASIDPGNTYLQRIAGYGGTRPNVPNMVGWQYSNGEVVSGARPLGCAPFGRCDMNELYVDQLSPSGGGTPITGDDMTDQEHAMLAYVYGLLQPLEVGVPGVNAPNCVSNLFKSGLAVAESARDYAQQGRDATNIVSTQVLAVGAAVGALAPSHIDEQTLANDLATQLNATLPAGVIALLAKLLAVPVTPAVSTSEVTS